MSVKLINDNSNLNTINNKAKETHNQALESSAIKIAESVQNAHFGPKASDISSMKALQGMPEISLDELDAGTTIYDHVVVGGGVAGVFTAEILSRDGSKVALVEKHQRIGEESSGEQHGWGQFGALYLNAQDPGVAEACLHNVDLLKDDYHVLAGNNLEASKDNPKELISQDPKNPKSWYRDDPIYYYYPDANDKNLNLDPVAQKKWNETLGRVVHRTGVITEHNWNTKQADSLAPNETLEKKALTAKKAATKWKKKTIENNPNGNLAKRNEADKIINRDLSNYSIISSHDRPMRSINIMSSVHDQFIRNGGKDIMGTEIVDYQESDEGVIELTTKDQQKIEGRHVIFTSGGGINDLKGAKTNTVLSPLLVVTPAVCERNFVHITPLKEHTINHIHHSDPLTGQTYSLIGNGDGVKPSDKEGLAKSKAGILQYAEELFPEMHKRSNENKVVYFGHKNEILKEGHDRNYHFELVQLKGKQVMAAVPGKFTLAPSLAHHVYQTIHGKKAPAIPSDVRVSEGEKAKTAPQLHRQIVAKEIESPSMRKRRNHVAVKPRPMFESGIL